MAERRQKLRGTTLELDQYIGNPGQLLYNTDNHELRTYDGALQGGYRIPTLQTAQDAFELPERLRPDGKYVANANDAVESGFYQVDETGVNTPIAGSPGAIITSVNTDGYIFQNFYRRVGSESFRRIFNGGTLTWGAWELMPGRNYLELNYYSKIESDDRFFIVDPIINLVSPLVGSGPAILRFRDNDQVPIGYVGLGSSSNDIVSLTRNTPGSIWINPGASGDVRIFGPTLVIDGAVTISSGTITGITDLAVADGGTGASTATAARANIGANSATNLTTGTIPSARVSGSYAGITGTGTLNAGAIGSGFGSINIGSSVFTGNGSGLTSLNASALSSGTIPTARQGSDIWRDGNTPSANQLAAALDGATTLITLGGSASSLPATQLELRDDSSGIMSVRLDSGGSGDLIRLGNSNGNAAIEVSAGSGIITYNTGSDYRRKPHRTDLLGFEDRFMRLKPAQWYWHGDMTLPGRGLIAHEVAEAGYDQSTVSGEKDAIDENGEPVYQSMDYSSAELIADMIAMIQQLRHKVEQLELQQGSIQ